MEAKINKYGKYKCPCCGYYTFDNELGNTYEICDLCFWEDDILQLENPDLDGGANEMSLNEARENFKKFGVKDEWLKAKVRPPNFDELE